MGESVAVEEDPVASFLQEARDALAEAAGIITEAIGSDLEGVVAARLLACVERAGVLVRCSVRVRRVRCAAPAAAAASSPSRAWCCKEKCECDPCCYCNMTRAERSRGA